MIILEGLTEQLFDLFKNGKTNERQFEKYLQKNHYLAAHNEKFADSDLDKLYSEITQSTNSEYLLILGSM
ncbi:hypothetical protein V8C42DRAFT_364087 [Trichoderma barbatum]